MVVALMEHGTIDKNSRDKPFFEDERKKDYEYCLMLKKRQKRYFIIRKIIRNIKKNKPKRYKRLRNVARSIVALQLEYRELATPFNENVCKKCNENCCYGVPVMYLKNVDYLYYEILGVKLPDVKLKFKMWASEQDIKEKCMFLDEKNGCKIPIHLRPILCITTGITSCDYNIPDDKRAYLERLRIYERMKRLRAISFEFDNLYDKMWSILTNDEKLKIHSVY